MNKPSKHLKGSAEAQDNKKTVKEWEATDSKICTATIRRGLYYHGPKGCHARKKPLQKNKKKARLMFAAEQQNLGETFSGKIQKKAWAWQHHIVGVFCWIKDWCCS